MSETDLRKRIQLEFSNNDTRLFRNNVGEAWVGEHIPLRRGPHERGLTLELRNARRIQFGLAPGSSDLIGWRSVVVTAEMVGQRVAIFTGIEVKQGSGA